MSSKTLKTLVGLLAFFVCFCISFCKSNAPEKKLAEMVEQVNRTTNKSTLVGTLDELKIVDNTLEYHFTLDTSNVDVTMLEKHPETLKERGKIMLRVKDNGMQEVLGLLSQCDGYSLKMVYNLGKGVKRDAVFTHDEIAYALANPLNSKEAYKLLTEMEIKLMMGDLPITIETGITVTEVKCTDVYIDYVCTIDEDLYDMSMMKSSLSDVKASIREGFIEPSGWQLLNTLTKAEMGLRYIYRGSKTGTETIVSIEPAEIASDLCKCEKRAKTYNFK